MKIPLWAWWMGVGTLAGAVVMGLLAPVLFLVDTSLFRLGSGYEVFIAEDLFIAAVAGVIAGLWGALGGLAAGIFCAGITATRPRFQDAPQRSFRRLAAAVTAVIALTVGFSALLGDLDLVGAWDLAMFAVIPTIISSVVAYWLGGWIWNKEHNRLTPTS